MFEDDNDKDKDIAQEKKFKVVDKRGFAQGDFDNKNVNYNEDSNEEGNHSSSSLKEKLSLEPELKIGNKDEELLNSANEFNSKESKEDFFEDNDIKVDFATFIYSLNAQVLVYLGKLPNPVSGKYEKSKETAKYLIDTIEMLSVKTKGNLNEDESKLIDNILYDLRMFYINEK
jgi:hypothetical protein